LVVACTLFDWSRQLRSQKRDQLLIAFGCIHIAILVGYVAMMKRTTIGVILMLGSVSGPAMAQAPRPVPMRPPLFFSESWKPLPAPPDDHGAWPMSQGGVASANLEMTLYGTTSKEIQLVAGRGSSNVVPTNLWTGTTTSPSAVGLRDRDNFVDL